MKPLLACLSLSTLAALPAPLHAQAGRPSVTVPIVRRAVGPLVVSAVLGTGGLRVGVGPRAGRPRATAPASTPRPPGRASVRTSARAASVLRTADRYVGTPYAWGGTSPTRGFDCSGFVQYVFARHAVELPRTSRQQAQVGAKVARGRAALRPGDLLFFATGARGRAIDHVAIYAGADRFIHASSSGQGVRYDDFGTRRGRWFAQYHVATRRVLSAADGRSLVRALDAALRAWAPLDPPDAAPEPVRP